MYFLFTFSIAFFGPFCTELSSINTLDLQIKKDNEKGILKALLFIILENPFFSLQQSLLFIVLFMFSSFVCLLNILAAAPKNILASSPNT